MRPVRRRYSAMVASGSSASPFRVMADCSQMTGGGDRMTQNFWNSSGGGNNYSRRFLHSSTVLFQTYPAHTIFALPALSPTMEMGTIGLWNLKEGDSFGAGDVLCSIDTVDFEAQDDGILAKILRAPPNAIDIPVGSPICVIVEDASDVAAFADFVIGDGTTVVEAAPAAAVAASVSAVSSPVAAPTMISGTPNTLLPSARFLAESRCVLWSKNKPELLVGSVRRDTKTN
jgi:Biotin-requiring enzyme